MTDKQPTYRTIGESARALGCTVSINAAEMQRLRMKEINDRQHERNQGIFYHPFAIVNPIIGVLCCGAVVILLLLLGGK